MRRLADGLGHALVRAAFEQDRCSNVGGFERVDDEVAVQLALERVSTHVCTGDALGIYEAADDDAGAVHAVRFVEQRAHFGSRDLARCGDEAARRSRTFAFRKIERGMVNEPRLVAWPGETHEAPAHYMDVVTGTLDDHGDGESRLDA